MEYNKNRQVNRYYELDDILRLNIPNTIKEEFRKKFKKRVFYDCNESCKIGILVGLEENEKLFDTFFIIDEDGHKNFIPTWRSLTIL